ncbi:RNA polymerase sigma factor [Streptomyces sp. NPDC013457]|uniref:RNA polymerase sigma factor n=1 Tax=Streptomyces sp. NPDC013457 TaxID=3364866 RepID=UPI003701CF77
MTAAERDGRLLIDGELQDPAHIELADFTDFYTATKAGTHRIVRSKLRHLYLFGGDADDIVQHAYEIVFKRWERVGRLTAPEAYLHTVAANLTYKALAKRNAEFDAMYPVPTAIDMPATRLESHLEHQVLKETIAPLPHRQQQILVMTYYGFNDKDIAATLDIAESSIRSHRRHARNHLAHTARHDTEPA